jgi:signal recognition particle receptor subunit beta
MAVFDSDAQEIVIRLVYDGPPEAGKTTSLRTLAGSLAQASYTPSEASDGRTLWFDWMEYVGGRFEGCRIRCQVVSVPGQRAFIARRRRVIESADVVVFVADSSPRETSQTLAYLLELREMLPGSTDVPIGVILQANKRDLADAIPLEDLRQRIADAGWPLGIVESIAADGTGIREAFIYAVRLALDRVRELMNQRALPTAATGPTSAAELLELLRSDERARSASVVVERGPASVAAALLREVLSSEHDASSAVPRTPSTGAPRPPDAAVPSGAIWPPVEGRAILSELAQVALAPRQLSTGDWAAGLGTGWRVVSSRDAVFATLDQGRSALIQWARLHASAGGTISSRRCIVLADDGNHAWRMWQIVRAETSLREAADHALREVASEPLLARLGKVAHLLVEADEKLANLTIVLPCNLDTIGSSERGATYIGLMPDAAAASTQPRPCSDPHALLRSQLEPAIAADLRMRGLELKHVLARLPAAFLPAEGIAPALTALLGGPS